MLISRLKFVSTAAKRALLDADVLLGRFAPIRHTAYSQVDGLGSGRGVLTREEWTLARERGYDGPVDERSDPDERFLTRAYGAELRKHESGYRLAQWVKTQPIRSVLEIGCGEMITGWTIAAGLPRVRYVSSDFDPLVIERARAVRVLRDMEKCVLDVFTVTPDDLRAFDLVVAWDVLYAFSDEQLLTLLEKIKNAGTRLVMCSSQIVGPVRALSYAIKSRAFDYASQCASGTLRDHGCKCSLGHYRSVAERAGLRCKLLGLPPNRPQSGDRYYFVLFYPTR